MTVSQAIDAVRVMLGADVPTKKVAFAEHDGEKKEEKVMMAEAELVDGTIVYSEGELAAGAVLYVKTPEGEEDVLAPIGKHATKDGLLVTVAEGGVIESIEEVAAESVEAEEEVKEEKMEEELPKEEEMNAENLLAAIAEMIQGYMAEVSEVKEELSQLSERFNAVADLPAAKPVKKSFMEQASAAKEVESARQNRLTSLRRQSLIK